MSHALNTIAGMMGTDANNFEWGSIRYKNVTEIKSKLLETKFKSATVNKNLAALRGVLRVAWQLGQMSADDYALAVSVRGVKGETLPAGRALSAGELSALLNICEADQSAAGARDAAIVCLLYSCGLRRSELVALDFADYDAESDCLKIRHAKGNKARIAYIQGGAVDALKDWLSIRGDAPGAMFTPIVWNGAVKMRRLSDAAIYKILVKRGEQAGINSFSPHDLRRSFISDLLDNGVDITTVSKMAGHSSVTTTARYDRRPEAAKRKAAGLLHIPYRGREGRNIKP
jgi:site-specific recombinase XerD